MVRVAGLAHIALNVTDLAAATDFYTEQWGLRLVETDGNRSYLKAADPRHHAVSIEAAPERSMRHVAFEVRHREDLDEAVARAGAYGGGVVREPAEASEPGHRYSAVLYDPDGNVIELLWGAEKVSDQHTGPIVTPRKLGHVVLNTPNGPDMEQFYAFLGLMVSDRTSRGMAFLRCNTDHHTLALVNSRRTGLQHAAFDVVHMDNVMRALAALERSGTPCIWGPGRHGPGHNIFTYYTDPAGNILELYAEMEQVEEADDTPLEEKFWGPDHRGDVWGFAGPAPSFFRGEES